MMGSATMAAASGMPKRTVAPQWKGPCVEQTLAPATPTGSCACDLDQGRLHSPRSDLSTSRRRCSWYRLCDSNSVLSQLASDSNHPQNKARPPNLAAKLAGLTPVVLLGLRVTMIFSS